MTVKLPEALSKDKILEQLDDSRQPHAVQKTEKIKRFNPKRLIPIAASLALAAGLLGVYFSIPSVKNGNSADEPPKSSADTGNVVICENYDSVYAKFDELKMAYSNDTAVDLNHMIFNDNKLPESAEGSTEAGRYYGETNIQEAGADEGALIKTDGKYIYALDSYGKQLASIECDGGEMNTVSTVRFDDSFKASEMYISGSYAVIVGKVYDEEAGEDFFGGERSLTDSLYSGGDTSVLVYDMTDKTAPKKTTEYTQQGNLCFTRMIGGKLYCISSYFVDITDGDYRKCCIPEVTVNGSAAMIPAGSISVIEDANIPSYAVITTLAVGRDSEPKSEAVLGSCTNLYATTENLFISEYSWVDGGTTKIYKFAVTDDGVRFVCKGEINGCILNQFSMSSQGEFLRVAVTENIMGTLETVTGSETAESVTAPVGTTNTLYILDKDMKLAGKAENLANGERIKSARFVGETAYIVTFRQTDPLFVIDTSDPYNPKIQSELKVNGFSQYLHSAGDGLLIGVGYDGTENGANKDGKISLFDVTDPLSPSETSKLTVRKNAESSVRSEIFENHKLFVALPNNEFAVPFIIYNSSGSDFNGVCYIRCRVNGTALDEIARYAVSNSDMTLGGTFIGDCFYCLARDCSGKARLIAFSLTANEEAGRLEL